MSFSRRRLATFASITEEYRFMTGKTEVPRICEFCLAQNELRNEVQLRGQPIEQCSLCHTSGGRSLPVDDPIVRRIFRALIRLHFSEWNYNEHLGGDSLQSLVFESKAIFNLLRRPPQSISKMPSCNLKKKSGTPRTRMTLPSVVVTGMAAFLRAYVTVLTTRSPLS